MRLLRCFLLLWLFYSSSLCFWCFGFLSLASRSQLCCRCSYSWHCWGGHRGQYRRRCPGASYTAGIILIWAIVRVAGGPELGRLTIVGLLPMLAFDLGLLNALQIAGAPTSVQISLEGNLAPLSARL